MAPEETGFRPEAVERFLAYRSAFEKLLGAPTDRYKHLNLESWWWNAAAKTRVLIKHDVRNHPFVQVDVGAITKYHNFRDLSPEAAVAAVEKELS